MPLRAAIGCPGRGEWRIPIDRLRALRCCMLFSRLHGPMATHPHTSAGDESTTQDPQLWLEHRQSLDGWV